LRSHWRKDKNSDTKNQIERDIIETEIATATAAKSARDNTVITVLAITDGILPDLGNVMLIVAVNPDIATMMDTDTSALAVQPTKETSMAINVVNAMPKTMRHLLPKQRPRKSLVI
jgi:hypothetical protein